jgi:N-acetylated-alpha-linked acidic dipeptidase
MMTANQGAALDAVDTARLYGDVAWFGRVRRDSGGPGEDQAAAYIAAQLGAAGMPVTSDGPVRIHEFDAYLSYPISATLEVVTPEGHQIRCLTHSFARATAPGGLEAGLVFLGDGADPLSLDMEGAAGRAALVDGLATPVTVLRASQAGCSALVFANKGHAIHNMICTTIWGTPGLDQLDRLPQLPVISINKEGGDLLKRLLARDEGVTVRITTGVDTGWRKSKLPEVRIPGGQDPDRFVLVGGHYCGWDVGVTDNGTGDAALLELARILWPYRAQLRRGVRICWWPGHSHGRYSGSTWYADTFFTDLAENCLAYHNIDSPGVRGATRYVARHTTAEVEGFCRGIIERQTGQPHVDVHRPTRAADQAFLANGVPSFSTYPLLPEDHPDRWPWTGGSANAWWWHTEHDTLDKADVGILAQDAQISLTAILALANAELLPFEHISTAREILDVTATLQRSVGEHLDLSPVLTQGRRLSAAALELEKARERASGRPAKAKVLNRTLMRLSRVLNPVLYSQGGRYHHDPAEWVPAMKASAAQVLPGLSRASALPQLAGQFEYGFLRSQMLRERNRLVTALREAARLAEDAVGSL